MAEIFARVGFPFLPTYKMPRPVYTGPVYVWKENFIQGANWKSHRLTLYDDGSLIWDDPQNDRVKGSAQLEQIFRRIGIGTLYNSAEQAKAAAKIGLNVQEYGLLLPFNRGDGGLELTQFAVSSISDMHNWMVALVNQMNISHLLTMAVKNRLRSKVLENPLDSNESEKAAIQNARVDQLADHKNETLHVDPPNQSTDQGDPSGDQINIMGISILTNFAAVECAEIWLELQETYHVFMSAINEQRARLSVDDKGRRRGSYYM